MGPDSPIDPSALQSALPPDIRQQPPPTIMPQMAGPLRDPYETPTPYYEDVHHPDFAESDRVPLTATAQPIAGTLATPAGDAQPRDSFQTVSDLDNGPARPGNPQMLGFDLEPGFDSRRRQSYGNALTPDDRRTSRSNSTSGAIYRAGSIMRAMSQRVVNLSSGEGDLYEQQAHRERSRSPSVDGRFPDPLSGPALVDTSYPSQVFQTPMEKGEPEFVFNQDLPRLPRSRPSPSNPLKGNSLGIFSPENRLRKWLSDLLVRPYTEPFILILIILQAVLLAVESAPNVFTPGNGRPDRWGKTPIDWAILGLFVVFTLEVITRIIVSGFIINAPEYSSAPGKRGVRQRVAEQYRAIFQPQRQKSVKGPPRQEHYGPSTFIRSFTAMQGNDLPETVEEQQKFQLARRAFLRHGWNRVDFVAVVSFWIAFVLGVTGLESQYHLYVFRMLSCLRILRLLVLTRGTAVSKYQIPPCA